ncbi:MAG: hypothetical protein ON057_000326 [Glomeribacter sp. 1016415]|nr:hypothetical protein [Glomeribacter sp. 1016415]
MFSLPRNLSPICTGSSNESDKPENPQSKLFTGAKFFPSPLELPINDKNISDAPVIDKPFRKENALTLRSIATGEDREIKGAIEMGKIKLKSLPVSLKSIPLSDALKPDVFSKKTISAEQIIKKLFPNEYSEETKGLLLNKEGGGIMRFLVREVSPTKQNSFFNSLSFYSKSENTTASPFNLLEIAEPGSLRAEDKSKREDYVLSKPAYWLPQGGYVDIKIRPDKSKINEPLYLFTPDFSGCALVVDKKDDDYYRVRHVEGDKEDTQYNKLPEPDRSMEKVAAMEYKDYGYYKEKNLDIANGQGFAYMSFDDKDGWKIHAQSQKHPPGVYKLGEILQMRTADETAVVGSKTWTVRG